jgi:hypothetical protein
MWSTRRLNDMDPLPLVRYASGAGAAGDPAPSVTHHSLGPVRWPIPEWRPAGGSLLILGRRALRCER